VPVSGHDKELFFRKWGEISGLGVYPSLCELVEGIVTVPRKAHCFRNLGGRSSSVICPSSGNRQVHAITFEANLRDRLRLQ
jgi:hypothetical protein